MSSEGVDALFDESHKSEPAEKPENTGGQPRDESGKFAAKQTEAVPPVVAPAVVETPAPATHAPVEPPKAEPGHVPISALLDEREKRQKFERELNELRAQRQRPETPPNLQTPEEIAAYVQREAANAAWSAKAEFSENTAREKHGDELVDAAIQWGLARCEAEKAQLGFSPFAVEQMRQRNPIDWVIRQHKRDALLTEIGDDPEAYKAKLRAELAASAATSPASTASAAAPPQPAAPKPTPRPSLASSPSAGGMQTVPAKAPFESAFN